MIPEAIAAMLAVARIGAIHSVVFGGFSADSLRSRIDDAGAKLVITADGGYRKGKVSPLKPAVDLALADRNGSGVQETVEHVLVVRRGGNDVDWTEGRDLWWHDVVPAAAAEHEAQAFPAENPLFILYTSGTTGKPKGILHTSGGYLTQAAFTNKVVHDIHPETDVYWCTADIGWVTGHTLRHVRPARERRHAGALRGHARHAAPRPLVGDHREVRRHDPLHGAHRHPLVHEARPRDPEEVRPVVAARCSARWASPSTPRRGCGTARSSAARPRRSSTRGGRPRPARS